MSLLGWIIGGTIAATLLSGSETEQKKEEQKLIEKPETVVPDKTIELIKNAYDEIERKALPIYKSIIQTKENRIMDHLIYGMKEYDIKHIINYLEKQKDELIQEIYIRGNDINLVELIERKHKLIEKILNPVTEEQKVEVPQVIDEDDDFIENLIKESQDQLNNIDDIL